METGYSSGLDIFEDRYILKSKKDSRKIYTIIQEFELTKIILNKGR